MSLFAPHEAKFPFSYNFQTLYSKSLEHFFNRTSFSPDIFTVWEIELVELPYL